MPYEIQRARWHSVKIDMDSGILYMDSTYKLRSGARHLVPTCCVTIPNAGNSEEDREADADKLIKRFEELEESIEQNNMFYHEVVEPQLHQWFETHYGDMIITMDGDADMNEIFYVCSFWSSFYNTILALEIPVRECCCNLALEIYVQRIVLATLAGKKVV